MAAALANGRAEFPGSTRSRSLHHLAPIRSYAARAADLPEVGRRIISAKPGGPGQGVVGDAVPHHRAGVDHRSAGIGREQRLDRGRQLDVLQGERALEDALQGEQPVAVAR